MQNHAVFYMMLCVTIWYNNIKENYVAGELSVQIVKEEMAKPMLSREQIVFWFHRFRKLDTKKLDHRRRLFDSFVNAIFLYDDRITFIFNYKDGSKTITFAELEKSGLGSDISTLTAPRRRGLCIVRDDFSLKSHRLTHAVAPPFHKKSRSAHRLGCKRPRDGSLSLPTFCGFKSTSEFCGGIFFASS